MGTIGVVSYPLDLIALSASAGVPLQKQLTDQLRELILTGAVPDGSRLPSIRTLAAELDVSRNTVIAALDQLCAEGLIESRRGAGTFVSAGVRARGAGALRVDSGTPGLSARGRLMAAQPRVRTFPGSTAFHPGTPELSEFPFKTWRRLLSRRMRLGGEDLFGYHHIAGHPELRETVARFLTVMRRVRCTPEQIVVTAGAQAALDLIARLLLDEGDTVWMEEPGYPGARGAFLGAGARLEPLPVDREGWHVPSARPAPRLIYITPSCQHPLGITMPRGQRHAILEVARAADAWIVEDDFDGEYSFCGQPEPSVHGLAEDRRVIYVGTFSKTLFPSLRLGFLVLPEEFVEPVKRSLSVTGQFAPLIPQAVLSDFIRGGFFFGHLNRMRRLYGRRRAHFLSLFERHLGRWLDPIDGRSGIQIASEFSAPAADATVASQAAAAGINLAPLSLYYPGRTARQGLLMGYAAVHEADMERAFPRLRAIVEVAAT